MVWVGRDLAGYLVPHLTMGRDTFPCPRLLQAPSSLALDTSRDGATTAALGTLCHPHREFLPDILSTPALCQFKTLVPCPVATGHGEKSLSPDLPYPLHAWKGHSGVPWLCRTSRDNLSVPWQSQCFLWSDWYQVQELGLPALPPHHGPDSFLGTVFQEQFS